MIIGKNSIWKMLALFLIVLLAALDVIFCSAKTVYVVNSLLVAGALLAAAVKLYRKWSVKS